MESKAKKEFRFEEHPPVSRETRCQKESATLQKLSLQ